MRSQIQQSKIHPVLASSKHDANVHTIIKNVYLPCKQKCPTGNREIKQYNTLVYCKRHTNSHCTAAIYV